MNPNNIDLQKAGTYLSDPDTQGLVILTIALSILGDELFGDLESGVEALDPAEVYAELHDATGSWLSEEGENKLMAIMTAVESDEFYKDPVVFVSVVMALYEGDLGDLINQVFEMPGATETLWAVSEVELARDDENKLPTFSPEVQIILDEILSAEAEVYDHVRDDVDDEYASMLRSLRDLGISWDKLRMLAGEYAETMRALEDGMD